jgi:hypothetical protein
MATFLSWGQDERGVGGGGGAVAARGAVPLTNSAGSELKFQKPKRQQMNWASKQERFTTTTYLNSISWKTMDLRALLN